MAKRKISRAEKAAEQIRRLLPPGMIPDSYIDYVVKDNDLYIDEYEELTGNAKMQLYEESGIDLPMTRKEAEFYLVENIDDENWSSISQDNVIHTSQVKMIEDSAGKSILDMIKDLPLIPAARIISSIIVSYLKSHGQNISDEREEEIAEDMIHTLDMSFTDMSMSGEEDAVPERFDGGPGIDFDFSDLMEHGSADGGITRGENPAQKPDTKKPARRSRITKFPGKS